MIEIAKSRNLKEDPVFLQEAVACMRRYKLDTCGEMHKYFDAAIWFLMEAQRAAAIKVN